jgi:hypothetical protein
MGLAERFANVGRVTAPRKRAIAATSLGHGPRGDGRPHRTMPPRALCAMAVPWSPRPSALAVSRRGADCPTAAVSPSLSAGPGLSCPRKRPNRT